MLETDWQNLVSLTCGPHAPTWRTCTCIVKSRAGMQHVQRRVRERTRARSVGGEDSEQSFAMADRVVLWRPQHRHRAIKLAPRAKAFASKGTCHVGVGHDAAALRQTS